MANSAEDRGRRLISERKPAPHWHDITRLDLVGIVDVAMQDPELGSAVARHKAVFFQEKTADGSVIDCASHWAANHT